MFTISSGVTRLRKFNTRRNNSPNWRKERLTSSAIGKFDDPFVTHGCAGVLQRALNPVFGDLGLDFLAVIQIAVGLSRAMG